MADALEKHNKAQGLFNAAIDEIHYLAQAFYTVGNSEVGFQLNKIANSIVDALEMEEESYKEVSKARLNTAREMTGTILKSFVTKEKEEV